MAVVIYNKIDVYSKGDALIEYTPLSKYELPGPRQNTTMHFEFGQKVYASIYTEYSSIVSDAGVNIICTMEKNKLIIKDKWKGEELAIFYIKVNGNPIKAEAVKIDYNTGLPATLTIGNIKFNIFVINNMYNQIEYRFTSICRGVGDLTVINCKKCIVFYVPHSPNLKELYNELSYVVIFEYSDTLFATYRRTADDYSIYIPKGGVVWTKKTGGYALFNGDKTYYVIVGVGADNATIGEFIEVI